MRLLRTCLAWLGAGYVLLLRWTCRVVFVHDPRPALRAQGQPYAYAFLHAHQVATVVAGEAGTRAMVSRSRDGDLLVPSLRVAGVIPVRGSSRRGERDKGGRQALAAMIEASRRRYPVYFAVDGPRGPRGVVHRGVIALSEATGAIVLPASAHCTWRLVLHRTWDQLEIPLPGARIIVTFGEARQLSGEDGRAWLQGELARLEAKSDRN